MIHPRTMPDAGDNRCNSAINFNESLRSDNPYLSSVQSTQYVKNASLAKETVHH